MLETSLLHIAQAAIKDLEELDNDDDVHATNRGIGASTDELDYIERPYTFASTPALASSRSMSNIKALR